MKILITTDWYAPTINGVVTSVINLETELRNRGHEVKILTLSQNRYSERNGNVYYIGSFNLNRVYPNARGTYHFNDSFVNEIIRWKPDIIHSQCELVSFPFAKRISKRCRIPIVHTYHTAYEDYTHYFSKDKKFGKRAVALGSKFVLGKVDSVVVPSEKIRMLLMDYKVKNEIYVIPTGIDLKVFRQRISMEEVIAYKEQLGISLDNKVLLSLGRTAKEKNIQEIIGDLQKIDDERLTFLIVGGGPYLEELKRLVKEKCLENRIIFTGMVPSEDVYKYYQLGDVFVCGSSSETQGLTYIEALASGLPAVCRQDLCLKEVIISGENGYLYEDFAGFYQGIEEVLRSEERHKEMSEKALMIAKKFSIETFVEAVEKVYEEELAKWKSIRALKFIKEDLR